MAAAVELAVLQLHLGAAEAAEVLLSLRQAFAVEKLAHLDQTLEAAAAVAEVHPILDPFLALALVAVVEGGEVHPVLNLFLVLALVEVVVGEVQLVQMVVEVDESLAMGNAE